MVTSDTHHVTILESDRQESETPNPPNQKRFDPALIVDKMKEHWSIALKILELILSILCVGFLEDPIHGSRFPQGDSHHTALAYGTFCGYIIILGVILIARLLGDICPARTSALFSIVGAVLFIASSAVLLVDWANLTPKTTWHPNATRLDLLCSAGSVAIPAAILFLVDAILTCRQGIKEEEE